MNVESFPYDTGQALQISKTKNMQFVGKLTQADLSDVGKDTRSKTFWRALRPSATAKLVFRCLAVPMALASIAAVALVAALSFGFYGAAMLLALPIAMAVGKRMRGREQQVWLAGGALMTVLFALRAVATG